MRCSDNSSAQGCDFVVAVWGTEHLRVLFEAAIPTLLADGNLPAVASALPSRLIFFTTFAGERSITSQPLWHVLSQVLPVLVKVFSGADPATPAAHYAMWRAAVEDARTAGRYVFMMSPDVIWADGSLRHVGELIRSGKKAIYMVQPRLVLETALLELNGRFRDSGNGVMTIKPSQMSELALRHMHHYQAASLAGGHYLPAQPEQLLWAQPPGRLEVRSFGLDPRGFDPRHFQLDSHVFNFSAVSQPEALAFVTGPDKALAFSLCPFGQYASYHFYPKEARVLDVARWWLEWRYPPTQLVFSKPSWLSGPVPDAAGNGYPVSGRFAGKLLAADELIALALALRDHGLGRAAMYLALALETGRLHEAWRGVMPLVILAPIDAALPSLDSPEARKLLSRPDVLRGFVASHARLAGQGRQGWGNPSTRAGDEFQVRSHTVVPVSESPVNLGPELL